MAKSKNGGSRAMIRGRIGSDVYSVGKDGKGNRQQVIRSLAVQVSNPRTASQMFGRMIMSTVMQAVSALQPIIDHSFDGVAKGQPSISEFIRRNYSLVKADATAHPSSSNVFGLNKYGEKGIKIGNYIVSKGSAVIPSAVTVGPTGIIIGLEAGHITVGDLKAALGLTVDGYMTLIVLSPTHGAQYFRAQLTTTLADSTTIAAGNVASLFTIEGNVAVTPAFADNTVTLGITFTDASWAYGLIVSDKINGAWIHNDCQLTGGAAEDWNANTALPTYPTGSEQFLNGGDL
jgi:hypothetical protein